jgi:hypothetical protein
MESHQLILRAPIRAAAEHSARMHVQRGRQRLHAVPDAFELPAPCPAQLRRAVGVPCDDGLWMPVFSSTLSTTEPLGAWRYSSQMVWTFSRDCGSGLCSHCRTRCGQTSPACQMRCRWLRLMCCTTPRFTATLAQFVQRRCGPALLLGPLAGQRRQLQPLRRRYAHYRREVLDFLYTRHERQALAA